MFRPDEKAKQLAKEFESHDFEGDGEEYEAMKYGDIKGYFKNKRAKLQNSDAHLRSTVKDNPQVFRGLVITVNGYTNPSLVDLHRIVVEHGGVFLQYMDRKSDVTHIIASNLTLKKKAEFARYKVVRPEWVVESVAAGVLLPWRIYRLLDDVKSQAKLGYQSPGSPAVVKRNNVRDITSYKPGSGSSDSFEKPKSKYTRDCVIPPSDEQDFEDDEFPSYQLPPSSGKEGSGAGRKRKSYGYGYDGNHSPPSHQPGPPEDEENTASPVRLVHVPSSKPQKAFDDDDTPGSSASNLDPSQSPPKPDAPPSPAGIVKGKLAYEPECIIGQKRHPKGARPKNRRGQKKYLIKWRGYPTEESTWEFEKDLEEDLGKGELEDMVNDFKATGGKKIPALMRQETISFTSSDGSVSSQKNGNPHSRLRQQLQVKVSVEIPQRSFSTIHSPSISRRPGHDDKEKDPSFVKETFIATPSEVTPLLMQSSPPPGAQRPVREDISSFQDSDISMEDPAHSMDSTQQDSLREPDVAEYRLPSPRAKKELSPIPRAPKRVLDHDKGESPARKKILDEKDMTAEECNAALLADLNVRASSVLNPDFLANYFNNSRLHHLSTWKANLKADMQALAAAKSSNRRPLIKARPRRYVLHIDFDSFFASVSTRDRPELKGFPVAITHGNSANSTSSEIASCNYAARAFGLKNGMWMKQAKELCPRLVCLSYDFKKYEEASEAFYDVILSLNGERIQAVSVDEVLLDVSNLVCDIGLPGVKEEEDKALEIAQNIRNRCREKTGGCEVSVGVGGNILLAKLAMRQAKPAGMFIVREDKVDEFLDNIKVRELPSFGYNITKKVEEHFKADTVRLVKGVSRERLKAELGEKTGEKLWRYCRGIDSALVGEEVSERKTISVDVNYGVRFVDQGQVDKFVMDIAGLLQTRMEKEDVKARKLLLQVKKRAADAPMMTSKHLGHGPCDTFNKSVTLGIVSCEKEVLGKEAIAMLKSFRISPGELRGIGLSATNLEAAKAHSSQTKLDFSKKKDVERIDNPPFPPPSLPLVQKPRLAPYVKPRPTTLLDSFARMGTKKEQSQQKPVEKPKQPPPPQSPQMSQFLIPSQVDPEVLEEIRQGMREEAARQKRAREEEEEAKPLKLREGENEGDLDRPPNSQVDPDVWDKMPIEDRALYLAIQEEDRHEQQQQQGQAQVQAHRPPPPIPPPPQSPRKSRPVPWAKKGPSTPTKRRKTMPGQKLFPRAAPPVPIFFNPPAAAAQVPGQILDTNGVDVSHWLFTTGEVDKSFFETLDWETQQDVIFEARKLHTAHLIKEEKAAHEAANEAAAKANAYILPLLERQKTLGPDEHPVRTVAEIRDMMEGWFAAAREWTPCEKDVNLVKDFLKGLVVKEMNTEKAQTGCRMFRRIVKGGLADEQGMDDGWGGVVEVFIDAVQEGVAERGYPPIDI